MEYVFGTVQRAGGVVETLKTFGESHTSFDGHCVIERSFTDQILTDTFDVVDHYRTDDVAGVAYDWYTITNHYQSGDKFTAQSPAIWQNITDMEIEQMAQEQAITDHDIAIMELQEAIIND